MHTSTRKIWDEPNDGTWAKAWSTTLKVLGSGRRTPTVPLQGPPQNRGATADQMEIQRSPVIDVRRRRRIGSRPRRTRPFQNIAFPNVDKIYEISDHFSSRWRLTKIYPLDRRIFAFMIIHFATGPRKKLPKWRLGDSVGLCFQRRKLDTGKTRSQKDQEGPHLDPCYIILHGH